MEIFAIQPRDTYEIRERLLIPDGPEKDNNYLNDDDELTFHLGAFINKRLVSVASFYFDAHPKIGEENQFRLRGMATLPEFQGKGLSKALLKTAIPLIKRNHCSALWCNAKNNAVGFYSKVGFEKVGEPFNIEGIGVHQLMVKKFH